MNSILVFKTNIQTREDLIIVNDVLNKHQQIQEWSVDIEDVDCVLRVVANGIGPGDIITLINRNGYYCQELD